MKDQKGYKILEAAYWSSAGWHKEPQITKEDFQYAKEAGYMFDPVRLSQIKTIGLQMTSFGNA